MANTTNFNWETPDDTDLVKDGALAIRTLGNSIDTSLVDLKGGTTGQILSKNSNTDLDYTWINNDTGDITGVTAGTGISGGGTSGTVTITNSMATEITAAGDIIVGTGSGTFDNLPIGTTGQVLTADTTVSPYKVKWAAAGGTSALTRISTQTFTTSSAVNVNNVFSSTYTNYLILAEILTSGVNVDVYFRLRASGTDSTTSYACYGWLSQGSNVTAENTSGYYPIIRASTTTRSVGQLTVMNPFTASHTGFLGDSAGSYNYSAGLNGRHTVNTSYDGFSLTPGSGTITGTVTIYGYEA